MKNLKKSVLIIITLFTLVFIFSSCVSAAEPTKIISQTPTGGTANAASTNPDVSANGRYVAFESYASNIGTGSSSTRIQDIYVHDRQKNKTEWITHTPSGKAANGNSYNPTISDDGRFVAFASLATNLGPGGSGNNKKDIYVYDRVKKIMKWITHTPSGGPANGASNYPVISGDGKTLAFQSTAKNLGTGGSSAYVSDIYIYNLTSTAKDNYPKWITKTVDGKTANGASMNPSINENGQFIAFETLATNLGPNPLIRFGHGGGVKDIFMYDSVEKKFNWITVTIPEVRASIPGGPITSPSYVALSLNESGNIFWSYDDSSWKTYTTPVEITSNTYLYFYGVTNDERYSNQVSQYYFISNDTQATVWASPSRGTYYNYVDVDLSMDIPGTIYYSLNYGPFRTYNGTIEIIDSTILSFYGIPSDINKTRSKTVTEIYTILGAPLGGINPSISADGNLIAFQSGISASKYKEYVNRLPSFNGYVDTSWIPIYDNIFLYNRTTGNSTLITQANNVKANAESSNPSISGNGAYIAFETLANNLGPDPNQPYGSNMPGITNWEGNRRGDIFMYDIENDTFDWMFKWITENKNGDPANGNSFTPALNYDGKVLVYSSQANNLGAGGSRTYNNIFLEDWGSGIKYIKTKPPVVTSNLAAGTYTSAKTVTLKTTDPDSTATTYYTTDGSDPRTSSTRKTYKSSIQIKSTTNFRYAAVDPDENWSPVYQKTYTIKTVVTLTQLKSAAASVSKYYTSHSKRLPSSVKINGKSYSMSQFLYLLVTATVNVNSKNLNPITVKTVNKAPSPSGTIRSGTIVKSRYITYAKNIRNYINSKGRAPNYATTSLGKMQIKYMVYMYSKIVNHYVSYKKLPNNVYVSR